MLRFKFLWVLAAISMVVGCDDSGDPRKQDSTDGGELNSDSQETSGDPCEGFTSCSTSGLSCDGTELVTCSENSSGCLVETKRDDCGQYPYGTCDEAMGVAKCIVEHPCDGVTNCSVAGTSCDGSQIVTCAADSEGCLVEAAFDCAESGATCRVTGDVPECVFDPCEWVTTPCAAEARTCNGGNLEVCQRNVFGCLELKTYDCTLNAGSCDDSGANAVCSHPGGCSDVQECGAVGTSCGAGPALEICQMDRYGCLIPSTANCAQVQYGYGYCDPSTAKAACAITFDNSCDQFEQCTTEGQTCDGNQVVDCVLNAFNCLVETRTDCAMSSEVCHDPGGASAQCVDPCTLVNLCDAALQCIGDDLVSCAPDADGCLVASNVVDCTENGLRCDDTATTPICTDAPAVLVGSSAPNLAIPDNSTTGISSTITLTGNCTVSAISVDINITHTFRGDLLVDLTSPGGVTVRLANGSGGGAANLIGNYPGTLTPDSSLTSFVGVSANGAWILKVADDASFDTGRLNSWGLTVNCQ